MTVNELIEELQSMNIGDEDIYCLDNNGDPILVCSVIIDSLIIFYEETSKIICSKNIWFISGD
jgi:hypothetical protein